MRRPRHLSAEERALWDLVARQVRPHSAKSPDAPLSTPKRPKPIDPPLPDFRIGQKVDHRRDHDLLPGLTAQLAKAPVAMDARALTRLKSGKLKPEVRIDLHGMIVADAHAALTRFLLEAHAAGKRLVLVITGKGRLRDDLAPMPAFDGVLRHQVPQWLRLPPLARIVLQVTPAHWSHGGIGAYYVYLKRQR